MDRLECFEPARCATCWHHRDEVGCTLQGKVTPPRRIPPRGAIPRARQVTLRWLVPEATA